MPSLEGFYSGGTILSSHLSTVAGASNTGPSTPTPVHLPGPRDLGVTVGPTRPLPAGEGWGCPSPAPPAGLRVGQGGLRGSSHPPGPEHRALGLTCLPGSGGGEGSQRCTEDGPQTARWDVPLAGSATPPRPSSHATTEGAEAWLLLCEGASSISSPSWTLPLGPCSQGAARRLHCPVPPSAPLEPGTVARAGPGGWASGLAPSW